MENILGTNLDRIVILAYFAVVMGFGAYFGKYSKTTSDYFFGGRRFAWWLITISIVATGIGSHSFVKYSTKAYQYGFSSTMTYMNDWFFMPLFMFGWLPIIYYSKVRSIPEYFEKRFKYLRGSKQVKKLGIDNAGLYKKYLSNLEPKTAED